MMNESQFLASLVVHSNIVAGRWLILVRMLRIRIPNFRSDQRKIASRFEYALLIIAKRLSVRLIIVQHSQIAFVCNVCMYIHHTLISVGSPVARAHRHDKLVVAPHVMTYRHIMTKLHDIYMT